MSISEIGTVHVVATHRVGPLVLLAVALIVLSMITGGQYLYPGVAIFMLLAVMRSYVAIATLALSKARVGIEASGRVEGERIEVRFIIENRSLIPIAIVELALIYSEFLKLVEGVRAAMVVIPSRGCIEYRAVLAGRVGKHRVGPIKAVVRDPLGLYRSREMEIGRVVELKILPKVSEATVRRLLVHTRSTGVTRLRKPGPGIEFHSVREYRPGDDIRRVDWKHYAATQRLMIKDMEREAFQSVLFILDATPPMFRGPYGATPFEHTARIIATIARYLALRGDLMALVAYTSRGSHTSGEMARGRTGFRKVLSVLASIEFDTSVKFDVSYLWEEERNLMLRASLRKVIELLPRERNLIFLFTTVGGLAYLETVTHVTSRLRALGNEVYAIIPISVVYELKGMSSWAQAIYRVKTFEMLKKELEFAKELKRRGVKVIALGPQYLPQTVIRIIESLRA